MTTEVLKEKTSRYLCGLSVPAETKQIQNWLSCTGDNKVIVSEKERQTIEDEIVSQVQAYIISSQFHPMQKSWWQKIIALF